MKRKLIVGTGILLLPICLMARRRNLEPPTVTTKKSLPEIKRTRSKSKSGKRTSLTNQAAKEVKPQNPEFYRVNFVTVLIKKNIEEKEMLTIVQANIDEKNYGFLNTEESVGVGGVNRFSDVMLIQAMLIYVSELAHFGGYKSDMVIPKAADGIYTEQTGLAIISYQLNYGSSILKADGRIDAPSYENRKLKSFGKRLMTMTLLQLQAHRIAQMRGLPNYVTDLPNIVELMVWIKRH